jgi:hypothetical protein
VLSFSRRGSPGRNFALVVSNILHFLLVPINDEMEQKVAMLFGVVLIARPAALFGGDTMSNVEDVMDDVIQHFPDHVKPEQRLAAVGCG